MAPAVAFEVVFEMVRAIDTGRANDRLGVVDVVVVVVCVALVRGDVAHASPRRVSR